MRPTARPGRTLPYRSFAAIAVPADFLIPTCRRCLTQFIDPDTAATLEPLLRREYRAELQRRAQRAIETLSQYITQRRLEWLMDLSHGYLCRLRAGKGQPSAELVAHLSLLARDPKLRLLELERYCGAPAPPTFSTSTCEGLR